MASKQVVDRARSAASVSASIDAHADELQQKLSELLQPHLGRGEKLPDFGLVVKLAARLLAAESSALGAADRAHEAEQGDDSAPREERDEAEAELRDTVVTFRNSISASFGDAGLRALGVWEPPPSDTRGLERYAADFQSALSDDARVVAGKRRKGVKVDRTAMAEELGPQVGRLANAVKVVTKEAAELVATQASKDLALQSNDRTFFGVANTAEGLLMLAGRRDLAAKVRPSSRRPGVTNEEEQGPATPATGPVT